jgi:hypothetical protein
MDFWWIRRPCRESATLPGGMGKRTDVLIMTYDAEAKNYVFFQVNNFGVSWTCRGTVSGDTWTWNGEATRNGKTILLRFTMKWTSKDSFDFKKEVGPNADSMQVMMDGKETRYGSVIVRGTGGTFETFGRIARPNEFRRQVQQQIGSSEAR